MHKTQGALGNPLPLPTAQINLVGAIGHSFAANSLVYFEIANI